ncbi:MAG: zinc-binding dehydrogenase [Myxococcales bacterium FL481]|nr:MAG: zinc-binding dehydrogenase [Myxococcales bacterium FL481]
MQGLVYAAHGAPLDVLERVELQPVSATPRHVVVEVLATPIDPMDLLLIRGHYPLRATLPAFAGAEGCGRVVSVGDAVVEVSVGDLVLLPVRVGAWRSQLVVAAEDVCRVPGNVDPVQASMLRVNPITADVMLDAFVTLRPGDWLIQSPGAGSVGQFVVQLARQRGVQTISIVRRAQRAALVRSLGGELVFEDGPDLVRQVRGETGGGAVVLALDGTGGETAGRLASCLEPGGTLVSYGAMSRRPTQVGVDALVFRDVRHRGFWLRNWTTANRPEIVHERLNSLARLSLRGEIAAEYALSDWREALQHAQRPDRCGRVVLRPSFAR